MDKTLDELTTIAAHAARAAGSLIRDGWGKPHQIQFKGDTNLVTEIDHASEAVVLAQLRAATPGFDILTEESGAHGSAGGYRWVIDPLDGTTNFAHHFPYVNVSIGLELDGVSVAGAVYDPILDQLFTATRGGGAFLNGAPIRVSAAEKVGDSLVAGGLVYETWDSDRGIPEIVRLIKRARSFRINGSAALDICYVACGRLDAYCDTGLSPWDISGARVILTEAGGTFRLYGDPADLGNQYCIASNGRIQQELEELLLGSENG
jgi:myo-inositol-1(or 4)-monophosphatase